MQIQIVCVGKIKETFYRDAIAQLEKEIKKKYRFAICQLDDLPISKKAGEKETEKIKREEGRELLKHIPDDAYVIALCIEGKELDFIRHTKLLNIIQDNGYRQLVYVIGGSLGLSEEVVERADYRLSFSKMTFPHQLMRVMLLESIAEIICDKSGLA